MKTILIVDDSPTEIQALKALLDECGYSTLVASDGEEGIRTARCQHPDLILMDVVMPGKNGFQATRELSRDPDTARIPVIMLTGKDQPTDKAWGLRQGARDYLTKPWDRKELLARIQRVMAA